MVEEVVSYEWRMNDDAAEARRRERWGQTPHTRITGPDDAARLIERVGVATLFPVSPEAPDLFHAYMGDPNATTEATWDSPSGQVYGWRWALGRAEAAFYSVLVRGRPTWVSWALLPAMLRLRGETRSPRELYEAGELSTAAYQVAQALHEAGGTLSTGELRQRAHFPTGKAQRAAYLKAVDELDRRLLVAKVFSPDDEDMRHALVAARYPQHVAAAGRMTQDDALAVFLAAYLPAAAYAVPTVLARHFTLPQAQLEAALQRLAGAGQVATLAHPDRKGVRYVWTDAQRAPTLLPIPAV